MPEADVSIFNVSGDESGGTDQFVAVDGASAAAEAGGVSAEETSNPVDVIVTGASVSAGAGIVQVPSEVGHLWPRIASPHMGRRNYAERNAGGIAERRAIEKLDYVVLGMYFNGPWDRNDPSWYQRAELIDELHSNNPSLIIFDYLDIMESNKSGDQDPRISDKLDSEVGPPGNVSWSPNDWWSHDKDGSYTSTFRNGAINTNLTAYVTPDGDGKTFPEWSAANTKEVYLDPHTNGVGLDGMNIYVDVYDRRPLTNRLDLDGDGVRDDGRSNEDNAQAEAWRTGHALYVQTLRDENPDLLVIGNITTFGREYDSTDGADAPEMHAVIDMTVQGGQCENMINEGGFPLAGVMHDGETFEDYKERTTGSGFSFGNWQRAFNQYTYSLDHCSEPKLVMHQVKVLILPSNTLNPGAGTAFNVFRWSFATALMEDGYFGITPSSDEYGRTPLFDEFGSINEGPTGLSGPNWMGLPVDAPQRTPWFGTSPHSVYKRRYDNALIILNTSRINSVTIPVRADTDFEPGVWKRINGSQDGSHNTGAVVNSNFTLNAIDAIILEKV